MIASRRHFFLGASAFLAAPSIVRVANLMPISVLRDARLIEPPYPDPVFPAPGVYMGQFVPGFVAPKGSLYMQSGPSGRIYVNQGGAVWNALPVTPARYPSQQA